MPLLVGLVAGAVIALRRSAWGLAGRVHFVLFVLAAAAFVAQLQYWRLLGPHM